MEGFVHSMETFGLVDGPGVRFVVFLQGCRMRCRYCHNPETWKLEGGTPWTADKLFSHVYRYKSYWNKKGQPNGGITVSGGEPLLQIEFLTELFQKAKVAGIHTTLDTSGNPFTREEPFFGRFQELMKYTDLLLLDIKHMDEQQHEILTGCTNRNILDLAACLSEMGKPVWIRHVLVPGKSDNDEYLHKLDAFIGTLENVEKVEVLPYHTLGVFKWKELGLIYPLEGVEAPSKERIENAERLLHVHGRDPAENDSE